jgi:geranylgeranyl pyrophosphate synthase
MIDVEEARHRIERESLPLPVIYALQNPRIKSVIAPYLLKKTLTKKDVEFIIQKTREAEGIRRCKELMQRLAMEAYTCLETVKRRKKGLRLLIHATITLE